MDLNADLGEEVTDDAGLLAVVTSANVACGFHAGTRATMQAVCAEAVRRGVVVGAQVSYADRENFGRVAPRRPARRCSATRWPSRSACCPRSRVAEGGRVAYLKPHGALYHRVAVDAVQAVAVLDGSGELPVLGMPGSRLLTLAGERGRGVRIEGFPDRGYTDDGRLLPRDAPGALVTDADRVAARAVELAAEVDSVCVHGDSPGAVEHRDRRTSRARGGRAGRRGVLVVTVENLCDEPRVGLWSTARLLWGTLWDPKFVNETLAAGSRGDIELSLPEPLRRGRGSDRTNSSTRRLARRAGPVTGTVGAGKPVRWLGRHHPGQTEGLLMLIPSGAPHHICASRCTRPSGW